MKQKEIIHAVKVAPFLILAQKELNDLLYDQLIDLTMMSKIELGDDVIEEIRRLKELIGE